MSQIIPTAEPFLLMGETSKPACLLIHGFTSSPKEMRWMGEFLNGHGYTCLGVRLTGHATEPEDMIRSNWTDWTASVEDGYQLLRCLSDRKYRNGRSRPALVGHQCRCRRRGAISYGHLCATSSNRGSSQFWLMKLVP